MEVKVSTNREEDYLLIRTCGAIEGWVPLTKRLHEEISKHDCKRIILDHTLLEFPTHLTHYVDLVQFYAENFPGDMRFWRLAVIVDPKYKAVADFWETYCNNRGYPYGAFSSLEAARAWMPRPEPRPQGAVD
jgi:hypothetical protein